MLELQWSAHSFNASQKGVKSPPPCWDVLHGQNELLGGLSFGYDTSCLLDRIHPFFKVDEMLFDIRGTAIITLKGRSCPSVPQLDESLDRLGGKVIVEKPPHLSGSLGISDVVKAMLPHCLRDLPLSLSVQIIIFIIVVIAHGIHDDSLDGGNGSPSSYSPRWGRWLLLSRSSRLISDVIMFDIGFGR